MADQDINIRVNTSQTGPGLDPTIKQVEKLTEATKELSEAQKEQARIPGATIPYSGSSGLATGRDPSGDARRASEKARLEAEQRRQAAKEMAQYAAEDRAAKASKGNGTPEAVDSAVSGGLRTALRQGAQVAGLQGVGRALASLAGPLGLVVAGFAAVAGAVKFAWESLKSFATVQTEIRSLNQTLAASGQFSQGLSASIQELAIAREKNTGIDDAKWIGSFKELIRAGADANALPQLSIDLQNLSAVTGDLGSASKLMVGALRNEFDGFKELGIYLDENGSRTQKLAQLTSELSRATDVLSSGQDDASSKSSQLAQEFGHVKAQAGQMLSSMVLNNRTIGLTGGILNTLSGWMGRTVSATKGLSDATSGLKPIFVDEAAMIKAVVDQLKDEETLLKSIEQATDRKIAKDKASTRSKLGTLEAGRKYQESLIQDRITAGEHGDPKGIDKFTGAKMIGQLNRRTAIEAARIEKDREQKEIAERQKVADATKESMLDAARDSQGKDAALNAGYEENKNINAQQAAIRGRIAKLKERRDSIQGATDFGISGGMGAVPSLQDIAASQKRKADAEAEKKRINEMIESEDKKSKSLEKDRPNIPLLKAEADGAKKQVEETTKLYKDQQKELIEIDRLKQESHDNDIRRATELAQLERDSKANNREAFSGVVTDFKDGKVKKLPNASRQDFDINQNFQNAVDSADKEINPPNTPVFIRTDRPKQGPPGPTSHVQPGQFGKTKDDVNEIGKRAQAAIDSKDKAVTDVLQSIIDSSTKTVSIVNEFGRKLDQLDSQFKRNRAQS